MKCRGFVTAWMPLLFAVAATGWLKADENEVERKGAQATQPQQLQVEASPAKQQSQKETQHEKVAEASRPKGLSDAQISAWLSLQYHREVEISKWAAERAASEQVRSFAQDMAAQHGRMITKLHAAELAEKKSAEAELGEVLQELSQRVENRLTDEQGRINLGFRGNKDQRQTTKNRRDQREVDRDKLGDAREDVRDARRDARDARRDGEKKDEKSAERSDTRGQRRDLRDKRSDLREARRESTADERRANVRAFMREAMPFVRENLPTILDIVGESVETAAERDARRGWIDFQRHVAQKHIKSVEDSLQKQSGSDFDEAFLAYQVGANMQMADTLEVAQNYVSSNLRPTVDEMLKTVQGDLIHAQQLMQKLEHPDTSSSRK